MMMKKKYKNQIIIYVIAFMLVTAGYLNYTEKNDVEVGANASNNAEKNKSDESRNDDNIGDATLVNSNDTTQANNTSKDEDKTSENQNNKEDDQQSESNTKTNVEIDTNAKTNTNTKTDTNANTNAKENVNTSANASTNTKINENTNKTNAEYFANSKLERDNMYSQMLENYQKMLNNANISEEQKAIASQEIKSISNIKNSIMICENLITTKGFENVVIFVNEESVNVVVKADKLNQEQVAQIQNIVNREINTDVENIHIMTH